MKQIRLTKGLFALVSSEDFEFLNQFKWTASCESNGMKYYAIRRITVKGKRVKIRMHRVVMERMLLDQEQVGIPEDMVVDHLNHNSLDNRRENLEMVTQEINMKRSPHWRIKGRKTA